MRAKFKLILQTVTFIFQQAMAGFRVTFFKMLLAKVNITSDQLF